jgi:nitrogen fixation-related uncharacterized protein
MWWTSAYDDDTSNAHSILMGKSLSKITKMSLEDEIKWNIRDANYEDKKWI